MIAKTIVLLLVLFVGELKANDELIYVEKDPPVCRMKVASCDILIALDRQVDVRNLVPVSDNRKIFTCESIERLGNFSDYHLFGLNETNLNRKRFYAVKLVPVLVGRANVNLINNKTEQTIGSFQVTIQNPRRTIDKVYNIWLWFNVGFVSLLMGILFNKEVFLKMSVVPKEIGLSFCLTFFLMPMISFWMSRIFNMSPAQSLAIFIYGCTPGTLESNTWTGGFDGDFEFSTMLTLVSTIGSIIMIPAWTYSLGSLFMFQSNVYIPILGLLENLALLILPCIVGVGLGTLFPGIKKPIKLINRIHAAIFKIIFIVILIFSKFYATKYSKITTIIPGPLCALTGYFLGLFFSWIFDFPWNQKKTIAINTGLKNVLFALLVINTNFPSPEVDYVLFCLIPTLFQSNLPLKVVDLVVKIQRCVRKRREKKAGKSEDETKDPAEVDAMIESQRV